MGVARCNTVRTVVDGNLDNSKDLPKIVLIYHFPQFFLERALRIGHHCIYCTVRVDSYARREPDTAQITT